MSDITRQKTIDYLYYLKIHYPKNLIIPEYIDFAISSLETDETYQLEYERTTKNNLTVDAISRADAIGSIAVECSTERLDIDYAKFLMLRRAIKALPSVTPIRPKGHWIWCIGSHKCSNCEEYTCFSHKELLRYCPNCGADMREVEE